MSSIKPILTQDQVNRLWLHQQGLLSLADRPKLTSKRFVRLLDKVGALQVDSVNVVERAHYLTLYSRVGHYSKKQVDRGLYRDRQADEYWGHEASILPPSQLPYSLRRMQRFPPPRWKNSSYWENYQTSRASKLRVMRLIREHGALESRDFDSTKTDANNKVILGWGSIIPKEDKRSLNLLWHAGKLAISGRTHFRKQFDLAEKIYDQSVPAASKTEYFDNWLAVGLSGNGVICDSHLANYFTAPSLDAKERKLVWDRAH
ncbi:MAG: crosslink repair DNA glycosylase YcaQ family protein, partial [Planctomycetota bacterium]